LILDNQKNQINSIKISLGSFLLFRCPNIHKPESNRVLFLATWYKKPSLKRKEFKENSRSNTVVREDKG
jgi:hypothetical protein